MTTVNGNGYIYPSEGGSLPKGYATLPRRQNHQKHTTNGFSSNHISNGRLPSTQYATMRPGKPSQAHSSLCICGCHGVGHRPLTPAGMLPPLFEDTVYGVSMRNKKPIPWWEIATRKSRYKSCPVFNQEAHVVAAFEQSLSNMTNRLQNLTATAEQKDSELIDLRNTIEHLRQQSAEARNNGSSMSRQLSTDSMSSLSSACSATSHHSAASHPSQTDTDSPSCKKKKKKGWLRSSFGKAFTRGRKGSKGEACSDQEDSKGQSDVSAPSSPLLQPSHPPPSSPAGMKGSHSSGTLLERETSALENERVTELMKQLREKDQVLTDIRLEALTSAHQLESLKDVVNKMKSEMLNLKHDNDRLQRMMTSKSLASSQSSIQMNDVDRRFSLSDASVPSNHTDIYADLIPEGFDKDGKRVTISVIHGCHGNHDRYKSLDDSGSNVSLVGSVCVSGKTKWDLLDNLTKRVFKEYVLRVDPVANLGLSAESIHYYHVGEITRGRDTTLPELLPYGYLVGDTTDIQICLKGTSQQGSVDSLAFETLIPKSIIQRYVSLLTEHRRIILCGPSGTGKSYLAQKLAEYLVVKMKKEVSPEVIATFSVDHKSSRELRQYLCHVAERCETNPEDVPSVLILDNLHHSSSLGELFDGLLTNCKATFTPYLIGTMNQATCATTNLQLHHNFRWVLCANHMEPVRGFLGRFLRRKLVEQEARLGTRNPTLHKIIDYIPRVWQHLNKFLETHSSSDVTIGPRLFLSCPLDVNNSRVWFTDLWNYSLVPYLLEAVREGIQLYGRRAPWEDPANWVIETLPWEQDSSQANGEWPYLLRLRPEDVGYDLQTAGSATTSNGKSSSTTAQQENSDPLLNMLMRLQEAANYSSPHSADTENCDNSGAESNL